jgi:hypothetical protein
MHRQHGAKLRNRATQIQLFENPYKMAATVLLQNYCESAQGRTSTVGPYSGLAPLLPRKSLFPIYSLGATPNLRLNTLAK